MKERKDKQEKAQEESGQEKSHKEKPKQDRPKEAAITTEELDKLKAALKEKEQLQDKYLRLAAEFENFKKRMYKEQEQFLQFSNERILMQLLPIIDNFDRAREIAKGHKPGEVFSEGVEMILNQLHKLLKDNGVEKVKTIGERFDPHIHEAIATIETDKYEEDIIAEEISSGYLINGKLLRAAKVRISKNIKNEEGKGDGRND